jgi:hypothetical protein
MVLGIIGVVVALPTCGLGAVVGLVGLVLGYQARGQIQRSNATMGGSGQALSGIILGWICVAILLLMIAVFVLAMLPTSHSTTVGY